jgi:hypothetical protein
VIVLTPGYVPPPSPEAIAKAAGEGGLARAIVSAILAPVALMGAGFAEMLARRDPDPTRGIDWPGLRRRLLRAVGDPLAGETVKGAQRAVRDITPAFDLVPQRAVAAAERHAGDLVTGITEEARRAVAGIIIRSQREGRSVEATAAEVRQVVGLNPRWANAVANRRRVLEAEDARPERVEQIVTAYRDRLLDTQARTIARTELARASNLGALEGYRQAVEAGAFPEGMVRVWVTAHDDRRCPVCRPLDGVQVEGLEEKWATAAGAILTPPAHPGCRCRMVAKPASRPRPLAA